jgi:dihydrofolate synthase/folylpolyglutamate synthase
MMMNYQETLEYLFNSLPMFSRIGAPAYKEGLDNTLALDEHFGHPHKHFRAIHVAGTNGKGSVSHMLAASLQQAGYRTGLYTSPHLIDFRERIRIDGEMISKKFILDFVNDNRAFFDELQPSFFEMTVLMAFDYFAKNDVEVAVVEVGLGGRLDSTNIISPELSIITNISIDHTNLLGNTVEKIAAEKAGIIKRHTPVIIGNAEEEVKLVFDEKTQQESAPIFYAQDCYLLTPSEIQNTASQSFNISCLQNNKSDTTINWLFPEEALQPIAVELLGSYQQQNVATVLTAISILNAKGLTITEKAVREGLAHVIGLTGLQGRWQVIQQNPTVICDIGHNEAGIAHVVEQLKTLQYEQLHFVIGMVSDKDVDKVLSLLPTKAIYYFTKANIPRALSEQELQAKAINHGLYGNVYSTVKDAFVAAKNAATKDDLIFVGGSNFVVAEALE